MAEFFLELFSEEIPSSLQKNSRVSLLKLFEENFNKNDIYFKSAISYSTPNRLVLFFDQISEKIVQKAIKIKGPRIDAPENAFKGFLKSNNLDESDVTQESTDKGKFYFANIKPKTVYVNNELPKLIPEILKKISWSKSMRWADYELKWARPLKSILALFNKQTINFNFFHLKSGNSTFLDKTLEENKVVINDFKSYLKLLSKKNIILDQKIRKDFIIKNINKISKSKKIKTVINEKLIEEVNDLVESPKIIIGKFDKEFLKIPKEILITSMQQHQKYFPTFDEKDNLTNIFLIVANSHDNKGFIKIGNESVISARLSDAKFFWEKDKSQNLVKQVINLKNINFFNKLGNLFDKVQRTRKLGSLISDHLNLSKEKIEISISISKVDLLSDLVNEFPELQGILGSYFAKEQGFDNDISLAIKEHYLPLGLNSKVPKKPISISVAIVDKIDTLVGFFGINEKPTSSKDPFALRRAALGLIRIIVENNLKLEIKDLINYSIILYQEQGFKLLNENISNELISFLKERLKNYLRDKKIKFDIIDAALSSHSSSDFVSISNKCQILNKYLYQDLGKNILSSYKRASNILDQEIKKNKLEIKGIPDTILFKKNEEKMLFDEINEIRKYFSNTIKNEKYFQTLEILSKSKKNTDKFFDNVIVNDNNQNVKKNRLELLKLFCVTFDNFIDFSKVEGI